jgi:hypothetical protein
MSLFTSTRPVAAATLTDQDAFIATAWELTPWEWAVLTDSRRVELRDRIAYAPNKSAN